MNTNRFGYPISLDVCEKKCVILGGGFEATDKAKRLLAAGAYVQVIAEQVDDTIVEAAQQQHLSWAARSFELGDLDGAALVIVTPDEHDRHHELLPMAEARTFLLCVIDVPEHCSFAHPAVLSVADLNIALSSGGRTPALLRRIREDLQDALDTPKFRRFVANMAQRRETAPRGERSALMRAAAQGFKIHVTIEYPNWFEEDEASENKSEAGKDVDNALRRKVSTGTVCTSLLKVWFSATQKRRPCHRQHIALPFIRVSWPLQLAWLSLQQLYTRHSQGQHQHRHPRLEGRG